MTGDAVPPAAAAATVTPPSGAQRLDCIADLHLQPGDEATARAFLDHLRRAPFDGLLILGDLFEVWVGDDLLDEASSPEAALARSVAAALRAAAAQRPLWLMQGNRDFLLGPRFAAASGAALLPDTAVLDWGGWRWLLAHGDAWCTGDTDYQRFRADVRSPAWQAAFLALPLQERLQRARALRAQSQRHQAQRLRQGLGLADVEPAVVEQARQAARADGVIHGHTHRPAVHRMPGGAPRLVLSDWDARAQPPRLRILQLQPGGGWRLAAPGD